MKVSILAPIANSLYARVVTHLLCGEPGVEINPIIVRSPWSVRRIRSEWRRDGARLLRKVAQKMVLRDDRFPNDQSDTLLEIARHAKLPGDSLQDVAKLHGLDLAIVDDHNSPRATTLLSQYAPDVVVFTGGGLLRRALLSIPRLGVLNCHMGILPRYRGMDVVEWTALESGRGVPGIGVTVHFMDEGVDTGPILLERLTTLRSDDSFASIRRRMERDMALEIVHCVQALRDDRVQPKAQQHTAGRQYFVMHPMLMDFATRQLPTQLAALHS